MPIGEWVDFLKSCGLLMGLVDPTLAGAEFKCLQSIPRCLRLKHLAKEQKLFPIIKLAMGEV